MSIYDYLEDWDNPEIPREQWLEQMEEAIDSYNEEYGKEYNHRFVRHYENWKRAKYSPFREPTE